MTLRLTDALGAINWSENQSPAFASYFLNLLSGRNGSSAALVLSSTGSEKDDRGTSAGLSNPIDRSFLVALRNRSTVVVTSGATARAEGIHFPKHGRLALLTQEAEVVVPKVSGTGEIWQVHWGERRRTRPLEVSCRAKKLQISIDSIDLEHLLQTETVHFETGMSTMQRLWELGLVHHLWLSHPASLNVNQIFTGSKVTEWLHFGDLALSLLQPRHRAASL